MTVPGGVAVVVVVLVALVFPLFDHDVSTVEDGRLSVFTMRPIVIVAALTLAGTGLARPAKEEQENTLERRAILEAVTGIASLASGLFGVFGRLDI